MQKIYNNTGIYLRNNIKRHCTILKDIIPNINVFSKHNIPYIDRIEIQIYNPNTVSKYSIYRNNIFTSTIWFKKNGLVIYKEFDDTNFEKMMNKINIFISDEIKI